MKSVQRVALLCLISVSLPLAVACGSNDASNLFAPSAGSSATSSGGSLGSSGSSGTSSVGHAGQSSAGSASSSAGSSGGSGIAGHGTSEGGTGGTGVAGFGAGGMSAAGQAGSPNGGAGGGSTAGNAGIGGGSAGFAGSNVGAGGMSGGSGGSAIGGFGGSSGSGGSGGAGCPADGKPPQDNGVCTTPTPDNCFYSGEACSCLSDGQTTTRHWGCYGTPDKCPTASDTHPTDGASCKGFGGGLCPYAADDFCVCVPGIGGAGAEPKWACSAKTPFCPDTKPGSTPCGINVKTCSYSDRECFCSGVGDWVCQ